MKARLSGTVVVAATVECDPHTIDWLDRSAMVLEARGDLTPAVAFYRRALAFTEQPDHLDYFDEEGRDYFRQKLVQLEARIPADLHRGVVLPTALMTSGQRGWRPDPGTFVDASPAPSWNMDPGARPAIRVCTCAASEPFATFMRRAASERLRTAR